METNHPAITIDPATLPKSDNVIFSESSFFKKGGANVKLPTPAMVRAEATKPKNLPGRWALKPYVVPFFSMNLVVKYGSSLSIAEGQCLWVIRKSLGHQVPVPEVFGWCRDGGEVFIFQQLVEGQTLEDARDTLAEVDRAQIYRQLRHIVTSLRSLRQPPHDSFLGGIGRQPLRDYIFRDCQRLAGPFALVKTFNDYFINLLWTGPGLPDPKYIHPKRPGLPDDVPVFFTHADLTPNNIILSPSQPGQQPRIVAIVDWHQSGWYPAFWEACKSIYNAAPNSTWGKGLPSVFAPYHDVPATFMWMRSAGVGL